MTDARRLYAGGVKAGDMAETMFYLAHRRIASIHSTFVEIMTGPNPLSPSEIRKLAEKRPELWGRFSAYAQEPKA